jgi:hypothetical protein
LLLKKRLYGIVRVVINHATEVTKMHTHRGIKIRQRGEGINSFVFAVGRLSELAGDTLQDAIDIIDEILVDTFEHRGVMVGPGDGDEIDEISCDVRGITYRMRCEEPAARRTAMIAIIDRVLGNGVN